MPIQFTVKFMNEENTSHYQEAVLAWLEVDFNNRGKPESHFWHNRSTIQEAFNNGSALVTLNQQDEPIGYMIWELNNDGAKAEINIIEVKDEYRRQGLFKKMLSAFCDRYSEIAVLSARVLPQSEEVFSQSGWQIVYGAFNRQKKYIKIVKPGLVPHDQLPSGCVIAICPEDYYKVQTKPEHYQAQMKYFQIQLDQNGKLDKPIITEFQYEGYVGVYFNKELIDQGKAKHLFETMHDHRDINFFIMDRIKIQSHKLKFFNEKGFFSQFYPEHKQQKESAILDENNNKKHGQNSYLTFYSNDLDTNNNNQSVCSSIGAFELESSSKVDNRVVPITETTKNKKSQKRQQVETKHTLFQPFKKIALKEFQKHEFNLEMKNQELEEKNKINETASKNDHYSNNKLTGDDLPKLIRKG